MKYTLTSNSFFFGMQNTALSLMKRNIDSTGEQRRDVFAVTPVKEIPHIKSVDPVAKVPDLSTFVEDSLRARYSKLRF